MTATATQAFRLKAATLALVVPLLISACATLDEAECQTANWRDLGQRNGQEGRASSFVVEHEKACASHGIPVDSAAWRAGWEIGIRQYCRPLNGLLVGREGKSYAQSCPADVAPGFLHTYTIGRRVYEARQRRNTISSEIDTLNASIGSASDPKERADLQSELVLKQSELRAAQDRLLDAEREADRIRYSLPSN